MPDITGFTEFVNNTEIEHGQHIISELLEIIIKSDELGMTVNEIEGDAVLFYKFQKVPSIDKIVNQSISIFKNFHQHLKKYEHDRICQCGACEGAVNLSVKFIVHSGELTFTEVNKQKKLYGKDLIVIHKLLKNDIEKNEYLLLSDALDDQIENNPGSPIKLQLEDGSSNYDKIGTLNYKYLSLTPYLKDIKEPEPRTAPIKVSNPLSQEVTIDQPLNVVYELLTNLKYRTSWNKDLNELLYDETKINRNEVIHQCVVDDKLIDFETIRGDFNEGEVGFGERLLTLPPGIKSATIYYKLSKITTSTKLIHEIHIVPMPIIGWLPKFIMSYVFSKSTTKSLSAFKEFCEKND